MGGGAFADLRILGRDDGGTSTGNVGGGVFADLRILGRAGTVFADLRIPGRGYWGGSVCRFKDSGTRRWVDQCLQI